jgi:hypothetical protein
MTKLKLVEVDERSDEVRMTYTYLERGPEWTTPLVIPLRSSWWSRLVDWIRSKA